VSHDDLENLPYYVHHADLTVMGRPGHGNGLARSDIEAALSGGRPMLIAPRWLSTSRTGCAFVCWKETAEAARALSAALPLLARAERVVVVSVSEGAQDTDEPLRAVARHLALHGIAAEHRLLARERSVGDVLEAAAGAFDADLIVLGAYGHSKAREFVFGGCTRTFLGRASVPVLMMA
jgi:nucleotide-binding universal stress UspA family protein